MSPGRLSQEARARTLPARHNPPVALNLTGRAEHSADSPRATPAGDVASALREAEEQGRRAQAGHILGHAWQAWDLGDAEGLLALVAQARALGPFDVEMARWMDEAESAAREKVDMARIQRVRDLLRGDDLAAGLQACLELPPAAREQVRKSHDLPTLGWFDEMPAVEGRVRVAIALANARRALEAGDSEGARALGSSPALAQGGR